MAERLAGRRVLNLTTTSAEGARELARWAAGGEETCVGLARHAGEAGAAAERARREVLDELGAVDGLLDLLHLVRLLVLHLAHQRQVALLLEGAAGDPAHEVDPDLTNASKKTVTVVKGGVFMTSAETFAMIRGGHLDITFVGGIQISEAG